MTQALAPITEVIPVPTLFGTDDPERIVFLATARSKALAPIIEREKLYVIINDRKHVRIEGWTFLGSMSGVFAVPVWTRPIADGWEARVEARTLSGIVVGAAEAQCEHSEESGNWTSKDDYALRSMAQTRAASKALRLPLGFIMVLSGYEATPAEEMADDTKEGLRCPQHNRKLREWSGGKVLKCTKKLTDGTYCTYEIANPDYSIDKQAGAPPGITPAARLQAAVAAANYPGGFREFLLWHAPELIGPGGGFLAAKVTAERAQALIDLLVDGVLKEDEPESPTPEPASDSGSPAPLL